MVKSTNTKQLKKDISRIKKLLIHRAKKKGLYENFGDKEERKLRDKYETGYSGAGRENMDLLDNFSQWTRNVSDKDLK